VLGEAPRAWTFVRAFRQLWLVLSFLGLLVAGGCGARTDLKLPDAEALGSIDAGALEPGLDAGPDASADAAVPVDLPCLEIPFEAGPVLVSMETESRVGRADVVFLVDTTNSMTEEIATIRDRLQNQLAPAIRGSIPDSQIGVADFRDFPIPPYGERTDFPFRLRQTVTGDISQVQAAVNVLRASGGMDEPESQVEALYQLATGEGIGGFVSPSPGCPGGGLGYACLRRDALPVVLLFTDAPFHNGPGGRFRYVGILPPPHTYEQALTELLALGARVMGFASGRGNELRDLRTVARDTGAVDLDGNPLVFDIGSRAERLGTEVVDAIETFVESTVFDVDVVLRDPVPGDGVDVTQFVERVVPVSADPADGVASIDTDAGVFRGVRPGTRVVFELHVSNDVIAPEPEPQAFLLEVIFRGDGRFTLARETVLLIIPGTDGEGCDGAAQDGG
jgi:hypothetical protein